jgi:hypothetical protein
VQEVARIVEIDPKLFDQVQRAFNSIRVMRGQVAHIATCDSMGSPNLAPIGSMRIVDPRTVHVLQGMLPRTSRNLDANPRAAFSVTTPLTFGRFAAMLRSRPDVPLGYRVYCELVDIDDSPAAVREEAGEILRRMPRLLRGAFSRFCAKNLKRLLKFKILEIRAT